ncbi:hypothetical protein [Micromonospora sp. IBHARD004]|uniref:hypothetical protein n=1 Tax=Micromonospora sp. IBHARD004 TaxID=3457764 RepID=UPI00405A2222
MGYWHVDGTATDALRDQVAHPGDPAHRLLTAETAIDISPLPRRPPTDRVRLKAATWSRTLVLALEIHGPYASGVTQPGSRFVAARLLVVGQLSMVSLYLAGAVVPYLLKFTFQRADHCSLTTGCQAPGDVFGGPMLVLLIPAMIITIVGPMTAVLFLLMSFTSLARRRREMSDALRRWVFGAAGLTLAFLVFTLLPPGQLLLNWVLD